MPPIRSRRGPSRSAGTLISGLFSLALRTLSGEARHRLPTVSGRAGSDVSASLRPASAALTSRGLRLSGSMPRVASTRGPVPPRAGAGTVAGVTERRWALATFLVATAAFVASSLADPVASRPRRHADRRGCRHGLHPGQIARPTPHRPARHLAWPSLPSPWWSRWCSAHAPRRPPGRAAARLVVGPRAPGRADAGAVGRLVTLPFAIIGHHRSLDYGLSDGRGVPGPSTR